MQSVVRVRGDLWKQTLRDRHGAEQAENHRYARAPRRRGRRRRSMRSYGRATHRPHSPFVVRF